MRLLRAAACVALALLSACGTSSTSTTATPVPPLVIKAPGATLTAASGWIDRTSTLQSGGGRLAILMVSSNPFGAMVTNTNDVRADLAIVQVAPIVQPAGWDAYLTAVADSQGQGAPTPFVAVTVGGEAGTETTYPISVSGTPGKVEDIMVNHEGRTYNITFSDSVVSYPHHIDAVNTMLASLQWTEPPAATPTPSATNTPTASAAATVAATPSMTPLPVVTLPPR